MYLVKIPVGRAVRQQSQKEQLPVILAILLEGPDWDPHADVNEHGEGYCVLRWK